MQKIRIGVLMGGKSKEREVSFNSGRTICDHLDTACYDIVPLFQTTSGSLYILPWLFLHRGKIIDFESRLATQAQKITWDSLKKYVDFIYIAMHGQYAEDGTMQGMLEILQIPYFGSKVYASALGMDKVAQRKILHMHKIQIPHGMVIEPHQLNNQEQIYKRLTANNLFYPLVVKPSKEGSSLGVSIIRTQKELMPALKKAIKVNDLPQPVLVEEKIEGMEFSCIVITDNKNNSFISLPPTEIVTPTEVAFFDYEQKYMPGKSLQYTPARCSKKQQLKIQEACVHVMEALEFTNLGRIDGFLTSDDEVVIVDPNSFSGAAPSSFLFKQAAQVGLNHTQFINHIIETELQFYGLGTTMLTKKHKKEKEKKLRVAVLMGGKSDEKEISLESGRNITYKLSPQKYEAIPLFLTSNLELYRLDTPSLVASSTKEVEDLLKPSMKIKWHNLPTIADFVFIGLHGGQGENGCVQGALEMLGLPYNGSGVFTSALCIDKYKTNRFLAYEGFDVPQALLIERNEWQKNHRAVIETIKKAFSFPCIVKPTRDGCSILVEKVSTFDELSESIKAIFDVSKSHALIEECIQGMELTVGVIGNEQPKALPPSYAVSQKNVLSIEEKFLPGAGENQTPAPLPKESLQFVQGVIEKAYKDLDCKGYARIDCFYQSAKLSPTKKERVVFLEVNTLPGLTPATCIFHQAAEIDLKPMDFIESLVNLGLENHGKQPKKGAKKDLPPKMYRQHKENVI